EMSREESAVCDLMRAKPMRLAELVAAGVAPEHVVKRTIYALIITRCLDLGGAQKAPVAFTASAQQASPLSERRQQAAPPQSVRAGDVGRAPPGTTAPVSEAPVTPIPGVVTASAASPTPPARSSAASRPAKLHKPTLLGVGNTASQAPASP